MLTRSTQPAGQSRPAEEENKAIVRQVYQEVLANGNLAAADELVAPNYSDHTSGPHQPPGVEGVKHNALAFRRAFPDLQLTIEDMVAEGDRVAVRMQWTGTHRGELFGIPPTGKRMDIRGISITRLENGKCVEHWSQLDQLGMMQQLGLVPGPGQ